MDNFFELLFGNIPADPDWLGKLKQLAGNENFQIAEAENFAEKVDKSQPEYVNIFSRLAYYLTSVGEYSEADRLFKKDAESGKQTWWGKLRHAECIALWEDTDTAFAMVDSVYKTFPEAVNGYGHIAWTLLRNKQITEDRAGEIAVKDILQNRMTNGLKLVAASFFIWSDIKKAEKIIADAYKADISLKDGFSLIAIEFMKTNQTQSASEWFRKDEEQNRISSNKRLIYAEILVREGNLDEAEKNVETAYCEDPSLRDCYSVLFRHASVFDTERFAAFIARDKKRGLASGSYAEADIKRISENYTLLSDVARAESRYGFPVGKQFEVLDRMVKRQSQQPEIIEILGFKMIITEPFDAFVQFREIFLEENYYFNAQTNSPNIIDGGSNIGLSLAYFKWLYPDSSITAFEPHPELYEICKENIRTNGWKNITLHRYALSGEEGTASLNIYQSMPTGFGLTEKLSKYFSQKEVHKANVQTIKLSKFLNSSVDFLKLNIDSLEYDVLKDSESKLASFCKAGFIKYYYETTNPNNKMSQILSILEKNNLHYRINGNNLPDNKILLQKHTYPEAWSINILFTKSLTHRTDDFKKNNYKQEKYQFFENHMKHLMIFKKKFIDYPGFVLIETTTKCNAKCSFCPNSSIKNRSKTMSDELFEKIVNDLTGIPENIGFTLYPNTMGETFMDQKIFDRLESVNRKLKNASIHITSNFALADDEIIRRLYNIKNLSVLQISLHSFDKEEYFKLTGMDLEKTMNSIRLLLEANRKKTICNEIRFVKVEDGTPRDGEFLDKGDKLARQEYNALNSKFVLLKRKDWMGYLSKNKIDFGSFPCRRWFSIGVDTDGKVPLCCIDWSSKHTLGDANTANILDIYNSAAYRSLRENLPERRSMNMCIGCGSL